MEARIKVKWLEDLQCSLKEYGWKGIKLYNYNNRESRRHFNECSKCSANSEEICVRRGVEGWVAEAKKR